MQDKQEGFKGCPPTSDISLENLSNQITRQMITLKQNTAYELLYLLKKATNELLAAFLLNIFYLSIL